MQSLTNPRCQIAKEPRNFVEVEFSEYAQFKLISFFTSQYDHLHAAKYVLEMMLDDSELRWPSTEEKSFKMVP